MILLPALDEEEAIVRVIRGIPRAELTGRGYDVSVWVVDGRSSDLTRDVAMHNGAAVFVQRENGKGSGMQQVFEYLLGPEDHGNPTADPERRIFVMLDSDNTYPPESIPSLVSALDAGHDVVMGSRFLGRIEDGAISNLNRLGNRLLSALARFLYRFPVTDVCTGMWGFDGAFLRRLVLVARGFDLEADIFASACRMNARVAEVPITYRRRIGTPKMVPARTGFLIAWRLLTRSIPIPGDRVPIVRVHPGSVGDAP